MSSNHKQFFEGLIQDPDPDDSELTKLRGQQWRPFSQNPFRAPDPEAETPAASTSRAEGDPRSSVEPTANRGDLVRSNDENALINPGPTWVHLFYDLAWTATFANLTQNGKFIEPWDIASYISFFIVVWWLWASQALYTIHFYTNDWFHFASNFIQLVIFGMLAATTRGFDISTYILHSPGKLELDHPPPTTDTIMDPEIYRAERTVKVSLKVIAISVAASRIILLIQYVRVLAYARYTTRKNHARIPWKLYIVPLNLFVSIGLFMSAWAVSRSRFGKTVSGARLKFVFWAIGLFIEIASHIRMSRLSWHGYNVGSTRKSSPSETATNPTSSEEPTSDLQPQPMPKATLPVPRSNVTLAERLQSITTIILGEGINSIAGTLYAVISAPGLEGSVVANVASSAFIIYFIAYLYFEGPTGGWSPKDKGRRQVYWLLLHLPFLLGIVLLMLGVKNQFLLTSFLSTAVKSFKELNDLFKREDLLIGTPGLENNLELKNYMLRRGISWKEEYNKLLERIGPITSDRLDGTQWVGYVAWNGHMSLNVILKTYEASLESPRLNLRALMPFKTFMGTDRISNKTQSKIQAYLNSTSWPYEDYLAQWDMDNGTATYDQLHYYTIITELLHTNLEGARYIVVLAGVILICLSLLNLVHSRPRDRFQWGIVISRFTIGFFLVFLLLLNVGRYQTLWVFDVKHQAGVFRWLLVYWVLPTLAFAFGLEITIETILTWLANLRTAERVEAKLKRANEARESNEGEEAGKTESLEIAGPTKPTEAIEAPELVGPYVSPGLGSLVWRSLKSSF